MTSSIAPTDPDALAAVVERADDAFVTWSTTAWAERAATLVAIADALDAAASDLIPVAMAESQLPEARLTGELARTTFQLRLFAEILTEGSWLDARIDHADPDWPMGARPDVRRELEPLGPVVVFGASNFPFAFSVAGGDTAAALAAGCPVVVKAHPGHPRLSEATGTVVSEALSVAGARAGVFAVVFGDDAGRALVADARIKAGAFTGSLAGGRALFDIAMARPEPIPFYAEMGSTNPTFVTRSAAADRLEELMEGFIGSFTMGTGQFCTKPGILLVPTGSRFAEALAARQLPQPGPMLNGRVHSGYRATLDALSAHPAVSVLAQGSDPLADPPSPTLLHTGVADFLAHLEELATECFGPTALVVEYADEAELLEVADAIEGQLTATIHGNESDDVAELVRRLARKAGRVLWNGWPTGVSVTYAMQHGGPYPATTAVGTTSVGTAAIERFLRPVAYQNMPARFLPPALRDDNPARVPQRVDGRR